jgi:hypothetical protein
LPDIPAPPVHIEARIDPATGTVTPELADFTPPAGATHTVVIRTPNGPPNKQVCQTLKAHKLYWNPSDSRGNPAYPCPAWLRHHVPSADVAAYRALAVSLKLEFDFLDRNPPPR